MLQVCDGHNFGSSVHSYFLGRDRQSEEKGMVQGKLSIFIEIITFSYVGGLDQKFMNGCNALTD